MKSLGMYHCNKNAAQRYLPSLVAIHSSALAFRSSQDPPPPQTAIWNVFLD
ncbi:hypothetical protein A6R68_24227, partial [Neotoma lepida]